MKFLLSFAVVALFASAQCDQECFRTIFKDCVRDNVPQDKMTLCDEIRNQIDCSYHKALDCKMPFWGETLELRTGVDVVCTIPDWYEKDKACYIRAINDSVCAGPIYEAMSGIETQEDFIRANKKVCELFEPYQDCVQANVEKNCHGSFLTMDLFNGIFKPHRDLSRAICQQLIIPADEKDSRPDNFGVINVFGSLGALFAAP